MQRTMPTVVTKKKTGLMMETFREGDLASYPEKGDTVVVQYDGSLPRGEHAFNGFRLNDECVEFEVGQNQVIKGLDEGVMKMSVGQIARLTCSAEFAYGPDGVPGRVPPNTPLVLDVELRKIVKAVDDKDTS